MKKNFFDLFFFVSFLCILFTVGFHVGNEKSDINETNVTLTVKLEKFKGDPKDSKIALIDGKHMCEITSLNEESITLLCVGNFYEPGFLLAGTKYISKNQPIKAHQEWGYFEGRVIEISKNDKISRNE